MCSSNKWVTAAINVAGSGNLVAWNIKKGINLFNVVGTYSEYPIVGREHPGEVFTVEYGQGRWSYVTAAPSDESDPGTVQNHFYTWYDNGVQICTGCGWGTSTTEYKYVAKLPSKVTVPANPYFTIWENMYGGTPDITSGNANEIFQSHYNTTDPWQYRSQGEIRLTTSSSWTSSPYIFNFWCYRAAQPWQIAWNGNMRRTAWFMQTTNRVTMPAGQYYFHLVVWFGCCFNSTTYHDIQAHI